MSHTIAPDMPSRTQLARSKAIQQRTGRTFHLATRLLPRRIRHATYVLYAFFRIADDVVDTTEAIDSDEQRAELEQIRAQALGEVPAEDPVLEAFHELAEQYDIADEEIDRFIDAMIADIDHEPYRDYDGVESYMRGSAVAVANMMLAIMEVQDVEAARPHAGALAEAFQLTNFLRDVDEDIHQYQRIYLPGDTRELFGVSVDQLLAGEVDEGFRRMMQIELARTEELYHEGVAGIQYLPEDCQFGVLVSAILYADHHRVIEDQGYDVLTTRPDIPTWRKLYLLAKTRLYWTVQKDPEVVFRRVSAIDPPQDNKVTHILGGTETSPR